MRAALAADGLAAIETDMHADRYPTCMRHIGRLAKRLAARLTRRCPDCGTPGHGAVAAERGLPCAACAAPTAWVAALVDGCARCAPCARRRPRPRDDGLRATDPAHCARCNP